MAASVRIEGEAFSDIRYEVLANACQLADADHARGKMLKLWQQCTAQNLHVLPRSIVAAVLGVNGPAGIVESGLGDEHHDGIRIRGTEGRIEWLAKLRENAAKGGAAKAAKRLPNGNPEGSQMATQTPANTLPPPCPPTPTPTPTPTSLREEEEGRNPSADADTLFPMPIKSKPDNGRDMEIAAVLKVLSNLSGIAYRGAKAHRMLIAARLRDGYTSDDLRKIAAYCASQEGWRDDPKMAKYLRPETLYGPGTIAKYADRATAWYTQEFGNEPLIPITEVLGAA